MTIAGRYRFCRLAWPNGTATRQPPPKATNPPGFHVSFPTPAESSRGICLCNRRQLQSPTIQTLTRPSCSSLPHMHRCNFRIFIADVLGIDVGLEPTRPASCAMLSNCMMAIALGGSRRAPPLAVTHDVLSATRTIALAADRTYSLKWAAHSRRRFLVPPH